MPRVRTGAVALGVRDVNLVAIYEDARREPAHRQMPDQLHLLRIDDAHRVRARLRHQQPSGGRVKRQPDRQHAAQILQPGDADRHVGDRLVRFRIDHRNRIVGSVRDKDPLRSRDHAGGTAAAVAAFPEGKTGAHKSVHARRRRIFQIDDRQRVRFVHIRIAQAGNLHLPRGGDPLRSLGSFR